MAATPENLATAQCFFEATMPLRAADRSAVFSYVAVKRDDRWIILRGRVDLWLADQTTLPIFETESVRAGRVLLAEIDHTPESFFDALMRGKIELEGQVVEFPLPPEPSSPGVWYVPREADKATGTRIDELRVFGEPFEYSQWLSLWNGELQRAADSFASLDELQTTYGVSSSYGPSSLVFLAECVAWLDGASFSRNGTVGIRVRLQDGFVQERVRLSVRVTTNGKLEKSRIDGGQMQEQVHHGNRLLSIDVVVPASADVEIYVIYANLVQHVSLIMDTSLLEMSAEIGMASRSSEFDFAVRRPFLTEDLGKMTTYLNAFFRSKRREYLEIMSDVGGTRYPPHFQGEELIIGYIRNIALYVDEKLSDLSIPQSFVTPAILIDTLIGFQKMAEEQRKRTLEINEAEGGNWLHSVEYSYRMNNEVAEAIAHGLTMLPPPNTDNQGPIARIELIAKQLAIVARQLTKRRTDNGISRPTLEIKDEYDVQDLLHALLKINFDDIRPEEWGPSYAGSSKRSDFLLKKEKVVIEVKKTRKNLLQKKIGEELIIDIANYKKHPDCNKLICVIWDADNFIQNPQGLIDDLQSSNMDFVRVVIVR